MNNNWVLLLISLSHTLTRSLLLLLSLFLFLPPSSLQLLTSMMSGDDEVSALQYTITYCGSLWQLFFLLHMRLVRNSGNPGVCIGSSCWDAVISSRPAPHQTHPYTGVHRLIQQQDYNLIIIIAGFSGVGEDFRNPRERDQLQGVGCVQALI